MCCILAPDQRVLNPAFDCMQRKYAYYSHEDTEPHGANNYLLLSTTQPLHPLCFRGLLAPPPQLCNIISILLPRHQNIMPIIKHI